MKSLKALAVAAIVTLAPLQQAAATRDIGDIYTQCGIGGIIAPKIPVLAVITNFITTFGALAVISELTAPELCHGSRLRAAEMIYRTYPTLEKELAQGRGANVDALLTLANCQDGARAPLTNALRGDLAAAAQSADYSSQSRLDQAKNLNRAFTERVQGEFAQSCNLV